MFLEPTKQVVIFATGLMNDRRGLGGLPDKCTTIGGRYLLQ